MDAGAILLMLMAIIVIAGFIIYKFEPPLTPEREFNILHGPLNEKMICPHCQESNCVHRKIVKQKTGISGGKAVGAFMTAGLSTAITGISKHGMVTTCFCKNCESEWKI